MRILFLLLAIFYSREALTCSCAPYDVGAFSQKAKKVYLGKVLNTRELGDNGFSATSISVYEKFIGQPFELEEVISDSSNCRVNFVTGEAYLIFEYEQGYTNMCVTKMTKYIPELEWNLKALRIISDIRT